MLLTILRRTAWLQGNKIYDKSLRGNQELYRQTETDNEQSCRAKHSIVENLVWVGACLVVRASVLIPFDFRGGRKGVESDDAKSSPKLLKSAGGWT